MWIGGEKSFKTSYKASINYLDIISSKLGVNKIGWKFVDDNSEVEEWYEN